MDSISMTHRGLHFMRRFLLPNVSALLCLAIVVACRSESESIIRQACADAAKMEFPRKSMEMIRRYMREMPAVTEDACVPLVLKRLDKVRRLLTADKAGEPLTVKGCEWAADAMEVFGSMDMPPFRIQRGLHIMERCVTVVGRAWTRAPDDPSFAALHERLVAQLRTHTK